MVNKILFDKKLWLNNQSRLSKEWDKYSPLYNHIADIILENIKMQNRNFIDVFEINKKSNYIINNIKYINYDYCDYNALYDEKNLNILENHYDLIISNLDMHYINDVQAFLNKIKLALKPNGFFICSFFGDENLPELNYSIYHAENELYNGISPRIPPTIDVKTAGNLLKSTGYNNSVASLEDIVVEYDSPIDLLRDIKFSGQGNILNLRSRKFFTKKLLSKILEKYQKFYDNEKNTFLATFKIVIISGNA